MEWLSLGKAERKVSLARPRDPAETSVPMGRAIRPQFWLSLAVSGEPIRLVKCPEGQ